MHPKRHRPFAFPGSRIANPLLLIGVIALIGALVAPSAITQASDPCAAPYNPAINPADFEDADGEPNDVDNPYFPLKPGTTFIYEGEEDGQVERGEVRVTRDTKTILGVRTVVVRDRVTLDGELVEVANDWYAQDTRGNVWYFGEEVNNYENGKLKDHAGSWETGQNGAKPGIIMQARPKVGDTYRQEFAPGVAEDAATILSLNKRVSVPYGSFNNVLQTRDFSCIEPVDEHKYYARDVGLIKAVTVRNGRERPNLERVALVSIKTSAGAAD